MAENQAEDEDDELFGDFTFVSSSNHSNQQQQPPHNEDEGDWGDFVDNFSNSNNNYDFFPYRSSDGLNNSSVNGFFSSQNPSGASEAARDLDPFASISDHRFHVESDVDLNSGTAVEKRWEKLKGAIPLSIFGGEDEAEMEKPSLGGGDDDQRNLFSVKRMDSVNGGLSFGSGVGISDLLVNLYAQAEQKSEIKSERDVVLETADESGDFDEDEWEFQDAFNEMNEGKKDEDALEIPVEVARETTTSWAPIHGFIEVNGGLLGGSEGFKNSSAFSNNKQSGVDWFATSDGGSHQPDIVANDFIFDLGGAPTNANGSSSSLFHELDLIGIDNRLNASLNDGSCISEGKVPTFDMLGQPKEKLELANLSAVETTYFMFDSRSQGNGREMGNHHDALPLPIFSNHKLDSAESLFNDDIFSHQSPHSLKNGINNQNSDISFNDLISNLYSQAEHSPTVSSTLESNAGEALTDSNLHPVNDEADFGEDSWEFKDAFSDSILENQSSVLDARLEDTKRFSLDSGSVNFVDFYSKLKEELYFIALHHIDDIKEAQKTASLSGDDAKAATLQGEIQAAYKNLGIDDVVSNHVCKKDHSTPDIYVTEFLEVMKEHKYQVLESEYQLSKRISSAEKDLTAAVELFEHAVSMVKILTLASMEDQFNYATRWAELISACAQELKHGALIWKQSLEENLHQEILSKSKGQQYIVALGEIYRVVEVLRASATVYKPWILSSLVDPTSVFVSLEECDAAWSASALEEALHSTISYSLNFEYEGTPEKLLDSIKSIHNHNTTELQNHVNSMQEPVCRLSMLSQKLLPDMKMVSWNGEQYFLPLANLWANCVSCDPPKLAHFQLES
ncbi:hypothetical protein Sjap_007826 [Stephania japonica]|uniref:Synergin gamma C-terminal domain-containing protein n=1 Tax=Stephania japonica TaxID=461633 RepID=A0AAP0JNF9_9MAGN